MRTHTSGQTAFWHATCASAQRCVCVCVCVYVTTHTHTHTQVDRRRSGMLHARVLRGVCVCVCVCVCDNTHTSGQTVFWHAICASAQRCVSVYVYVITHTHTHTHTHTQVDRRCSGMLYAQLLRGVCAYVHVCEHARIDRRRSGMQTCASAQRCVCVCENIHDLTGDVLACKHARLLRGACVYVKTFMI